MGGRINTVMQTCFFAISGVLPREEAIAAIKHAIEKTYGKRGESVVRKNYAAVDAALDHLHEVKVPTAVTSQFDIRPVGSRRMRPSSCSDVDGPMIAGEGDDLPVSAMPIDGTFPTGTTQWEKRNIALEIPVWDRGALHPVRQVRDGLPARRDSRQGLRFSRRRRRARQASSPCLPSWREFKDLKYTLQVAPEDCTGCSLCVEVCPAKSKSEVKHKAINMVAQPPLREAKHDQLGLLPEDSARPSAPRSLTPR